MTAELDPILVVARHAAGNGGKYDSADVYVAATSEEAERFCEMWNDVEQRGTESWGGYPGEAYVVSAIEELPTAAAWIAEQEAWDRERLSEIGPEEVHR